MQPDEAEGGSQVQLGTLEPGIATARRRHLIADLRMTQPWDLQPDGEPGELQRMPRMIEHHDLPGACAGVLELQVDAAASADGHAAGMRRCNTSGESSQRAPLSARSTTRAAASSSSSPIAIGCSSATGAPPTRPASIATAAMPTMASGARVG